MPDDLDLDRAVDARLAAFRPDTVPPFAAISARKTRRDRRRFAGAGGAALSIAAVAAFAAVGLTGGPPAADRLDPDNDLGGQAAGTLARPVTFELLPDAGARYGDLRSDPGLRRCLGLPGAVPDVDALLSLPALYLVHAEGGEVQNREFERCLRALPDLTVTERPNHVRRTQATNTFYVEPEGAAGASGAAAYTSAVEKCLALPGVTGSSVQESYPATYKMAVPDDRSEPLEDCLRAAPGARVTATSGPAHDRNVPSPPPGGRLDAPVCPEGYECGQSDDDVED